MDVRHARQCDQQSVFSRFSSLLLPLPTTAFTMTAKRKAMAEELEARADRNGNRRPTEREIALGLQARKRF
jgi:hypothetical protein